ncbi:hypothetical protein, partial [Burkholderia sp. Se-20373]|uniref:hypothetical protein n=1 Tax=Burkholderia sp. Se-20373 TaxID=2703898 RepID=UPI0032180B42
EMECRALKRVRDEMGLTNVEIMVPFVRTVKQAERVVGLLEKLAEIARMVRAELERAERAKASRAGSRLSD